MTGDRDNPTDHDLLIRIDERVRKLDRCMSEHLHRHWTVSLAAVSAIVTAAATLAFSLWRWGAGG